MNWINTFELMCYAIVVLMFADLIRKKDYDSMFIFGAAAIVGYFMELAAVRVTGIYFYSTDFWLSIGAEPYQFPVFGGLMWGGLTVYALKIAEKFKFGKLMTALSAGMLIVTMDILLDVAAIRLDGGFWVWVGNPINFDINFSTFMSVIWVNFFGYMIEVPTVSLLTLVKREKIRPNDLKKQTLWMFIIAGAAILVTGTGSLIALLLNAVTSDVFSCVAFLVLWITMLILMLRQGVRLRLKINRMRCKYLPMLLFWAAMYGYCIISLSALGLWQAHPWFMVLGCMFAVVTLFLCAAEESISRSKKH